MSDPGGASQSPAAPQGPLVVLLGAVGAGKGTQAAALAREERLLHLATGDLFRRALRDGTPLGDVARGYMRRGELVPDEITVAMVADALADPAASGGVVFDGFPRTRAQAEALDGLLAARRAAVGRAILIDVPEESLVARVAGRWVCPTCGTPYHLAAGPPRQAGVCDLDGTPLVQREDDRPEVFRARLREQVPPMDDVVDHYRQAGLLVRVDGDQPVEIVAAAIRNAMPGRPAA